MQNLLLTCDKDFGELVFRQQLSTAGVILIRLARLTGGKRRPKAVWFNGDGVLRMVSTIVVVGTHDGALARSGSEPDPLTQAFPAPSASK